MSTFAELKSNKGTVSSELGKRLALEVLSGSKEILLEALDLVCLFPENKNEKKVRAGAAKIIECVAFENPGLIAPFLDKIYPALGVSEPQTRWMIIRTFGLCAKDNIEAASKAVPFAKKYIQEKKAGQLCLVSSADIFLGDYGSISKLHASEAYPILIMSLSNIILNEENWLLESFIKIANLLSDERKSCLLNTGLSFKNANGKRTRELAEKLLVICSFSKT